MCFFGRKVGKCAFLISQNTLFDLQKLEKPQLRRVNKKSTFSNFEARKPSRYGWLRSGLSLSSYFASARGSASGFTQASGVRPSTTSMAFWVQRRRSSTADSSDQ